MRLIALLLCALALTAVPFLAPLQLGLVTLALSMGLASLGVLLLLQAGLVSFGHALYLAIGAYTVAFLGRALDGGEVAILLLAAATSSGLAGVAVGLFVVRYRYIFFGMLNLAFSMVFYSVLEKFYDLTGGSDGMPVARPLVLGFAMARPGFELALYGVTAALALVAAGLAMAYLDSAPGKMLKAIKTNEIRLEYLGVSARGVLLGGYVASAVLGGLAGGVLALSQGLASPDYAFWVRSGELVFITILGGAGAVGGAFLGAFAYEALRSAAAAWFDDGWQMALGVILALVCLYAPQGLIGLIQSVVRRLRRGPGLVREGKAVAREVV